MLLRNLLGGRLQARSRTTPENPSSLRGLTNLLRRHAGLHVTVEEALQVSVVWACIDVISKALASSDWRVYRRLLRNDWEELYDDPLMWILNTRPNPEMTAINFRQGMFICALAYGNGYAEIVKDGAGRVTELWPLLPNRTEPRRRPNGSLFYEYTNDAGVKTELDAMDVYHLAGPGISGLMGDHSVAKAAKTIALSMAAQKFSLDYFGNGVTVSGVYTHPAGLDDEAFERMKSELNEQHAGPNKAWKPLLLEAGVDWKGIGNNAKDAQLIESMKFQIEEICRYYGVPPHRVQHLEKVTVGTIEQLGIEFVQALAPWGKRADQEADYKLFPMRGPVKFTKHDLEWLTQGNATDRATAKQIMRRNGVITANQWLRSENMNTIGKPGDIRVIDSNMVKLEDVGKNITAPGGGGGSGGGNLETDAKPGSGQPDLPGGNRARHSLEDTQLLLRDATAKLIASAYERYERKLRNREADLQSWAKPQHEIDAHLENFRSVERERIWSELTKGVELLARIAHADGEAVRVAVMLGLDHSLDSDPQHAARLVVQQFTEPSSL